MSIQAKDLTQEAATSPRHRVGGYAILARMNDKARADIIGKMGDYHTDCPLDHMLLDWKGVEYAPVRKALENGASDEEVAAYLDSHGTPKTPEEVQQWSDAMEKANPHNNPEKREWFDGECAKLGLDGATTTLFDWLEADDKASYAK